MISENKIFSQRIADHNHFRKSSYSFNIKICALMGVVALDKAEFFAGKQLNLPKDNITFKSALTTGRSGQQKGLI